MGGRPWLCAYESGELTKYLIQCNMHLFDSNRYAKMKYRRCGVSGLLLPEISLGLWHNFGGVDTFENAADIVVNAFDNGITHFDLANNYGPPPGSAEETFGKILRKQLSGYRDELIISSKAGYRMWPGPYGEWGSKKYLMASLDQSLSRMGLDYVDIFYSHRFDADTPLEETIHTLDLMVKQGKALYVGISSYNPQQTEQAIQLFRSYRTPFVIHQPKYSMLVREPEKGLLEVLKNNGIGCIAFSPLAQGLLSNKYLNGIPADSRAAKESGYLKEEEVTDAVISKVRALHEIAQSRNQSLAQMAVAWILARPEITSVLVGVSSTRQLFDNLGALNNTFFSQEELQRIDQILG